MTAEIAILNSEAVALAADSAVTVQRTDGPSDRASKIFTSANKLFALSEVAPVGILAYGSASFMSIPWETIIKEYRSKRKNNAFDTLLEYANDFKGFLSSEIPTYSHVLLSEEHSGIAISGFGNNELLPSLASVLISSDANGIAFQDEEPIIIDPEWPRAVIKPFAQGDMMQLFVEGLAPEYSDYISKALESMLEENANIITGALVAAVPSLETQSIREAIEKSNSQLLSDFSANLEEVTTEFFVNPTMNTVAMLPKEQLAEMADALVNLTSLKRRVSPEEETVGGATDVAIITKGDGLVWIKRKQYFPPELNHAYFTRTYGRIGYGTGTT